MALMESKYVDKWIGTVTCQKILQALKMTLIKKFSETYKRKSEEQSNYFRTATSESVREEYK